MLTLLLIFATIPPAPRIELYDDNHIVIKAPPQLCYDVMIAFANNVEPNWRRGAFPAWLKWANEAKENGRIEYYIHDWDTDDARAQKELMVGLTFIGYNYRCKK